MGSVVSIPEASLDYVFYGDNRQAVSNYLSTQLSQLPQHFTEFGGKVIDVVKRTYNYLKDDLLHATLQNKAMAVGTYLDNNGPQALYSYDAVQNANVSMQRWIMAHPGVRQLYVDQNIDGYSATYVNMFGKNVGSAHYDYRRVMSGIPVDTKDGYSVHYYHEELEIGDKELSRQGVRDVLNTYAAIDYLLEESKFDFTNVDGLVNRGE